MKHLSYYPRIVLFICTVFLFACEKKNEIQDINADALIFPELSEINYTVDDNTLNLETAEDYHLLYKFVSNLSVEDKEILEKELNFYSLRKYNLDHEEKILIDDDMLEIFLNQELSIIIQGLKFVYNFQEEEVTVIDINSPISTPEVYSFYEDVEDIVINGNYAKKGVLGSCKNDKDDLGPEEIAGANANITMTLKYRNYPWSKSLKASYSKTIFRPGLEVVMSVGQLSNYDTYIQSDVECDDRDLSKPSTSSSETLVIYSSNEKLTAYYSTVHFSVRNEYVYPVTYHDFGLYLECNKSDVTCD